MIIHWWDTPSVGYTLKPICQHVSPGEGVWYGTVFIIVLTPTNIIRGLTHHVIGRKKLEQSLDCEMYLIKPSGPRHNKERQRREAKTRDKNMAEQGKKLPANGMIWLMIGVATKRYQRTSATRVMIAVESAGFNPREPDMMFTERQITMVNVSQRDGRDVTTGKYPPHNIRPLHHNTRLLGV